MTNTNGLIKIPKNKVSKEQIQRHLRIYGKGFNDTLLVVDTFESTPTDWLVPLHYAIKMGLLTPENDRRPTITVQWPKAPKFEGRHDQDRVISETIEHLKSKFCGRIECPTSWGKSITALQIAKLLGTNVLFLAHKEDILLQVKATAKKFFNIKKCGEIRGTKEDVDKVVCVGTMQTLAKRIKGSPDYLNKFGLICVDEGHRASCQSFVDILKAFNSRYILGISATFRRSDKLDGVFCAFLGDLITKGELDNYRVPILKCPIVDVDCNMRSFFDWRGEISHSKAVTVLSQDEKYNKFIINTIKEILAEGRRPIVTTDRKEQLILLEDLLMEEGIECGVYAGGKHRDKTLKQVDLSEAITKQVVLASTKKIMEGFDEEMSSTAEEFAQRQPLDTLVITNMLKDSTQLIGRISRSNRALHPKIYHLVPNIPYCVAIFKKCWIMSYKPVGITEEK